VRILVTGGTGIVGRATVPVLRARGHDVTVLTRDASHAAGPGFALGDLADEAGVAAVLARVQPESVVHLAWEGLPDYSLVQTLKNVDLSLALFRQAGDAGCRSIVATGSCWEYAARQGQINEDGLLSAAQPFHGAKNALRFLGEAIAQARQFRFYWLRLFFVYGPGQRPQSLVPQVVEAARTGCDLDLRAPFNRHDFVFVTDVARAIADVVEQRPPGTVYNVGSGRATAVADVVASVRRLLGEPNAPSTPAGVPTQDFWADISRIQRDMGWQPAFDLDAGLRETLRGPESSAAAPSLIDGPILDALR
jgi:nucleoside-diphosphate-sugar epimerase